MKNIVLFSSTILITTSGLILGKIENSLALTFNWSYSAPGIEASGTLITNDISDDNGFYLITDITGKRNDEIIIGLSPSGTSIPGNEPFELDNLISLNEEQLTSSGLGFFTSEGNFINLFFADFLEPAGYFEIFSAPPFIPGFENFGPEDSELPVIFKATLVSVPEPSTIIGLGVLASFGIGTGFKRKLAKPKKK
ncbi:PEP-CTERM sorting domain-containing protein [Crocosphaera sp.]|uniref:PEP-CTERM sorting domain-containing protein n=1 Tax=Crocosphaera sp. TaxID=2729996 RepID=UPI002612B2AF|nr:PEP-CTERM sorting domain-containing protein [Crocosphaera sp.]MDJ0581937.1 PEP-CTERM sorting domain-containing protein [Crocosphaera sp.]